MPGSFLKDEGGPVINKSYFVEVVQGIRKDIPPGHIKTEKVPTKTDYGVRIDTKYVYPDGTVIIR